MPTHTHPWTQQSHPCPPKTHGHGWAWVWAPNVGIFYVIYTMYIYSWEKMIKCWPILGNQLTKSFLFFILYLLPHVVLNLTMEWPPRVSFTRWDNQCCPLHIGNSGGCSAQKDGWSSPRPYWQLQNQQYVFILQLAHICDTIHFSTDELRSWAQRRIWE